MGKGGGGGGRNGGGRPSDSVGSFFDAASRVARSGTGRGRANIFAVRARQAIANAYERGENGKWRPRRNVNTETLARANKLIDAGSDSAIYGAARYLLQR